MDVKGVVKKPKCLPQDHPRGLPLGSPPFIILNALLEKACNLESQLGIKK
jgi:hypothetical protein